MAPLPDHRIGDADSRAVIFENTTIDAAGPYLVTRGRGRAQEKRWILICTCNVYRAVHVELLFKLDTDSFILAMERFIARRNLVKRINCDNGSNFRSASREMREEWANVDNAEVRGRFRGITFDFGPSRSPHFQGLAEAQVKSVKWALKSLLTPGRMDDEMLLTMSTIAERILNERPITYTSGNPQDLKAV